MKVVFTGYNEGEDESDFTVGKEYEVVDFFEAIGYDPAGVAVLDNLGEDNSLWDGEFTIVPEE